MDDRQTKISEGEGLLEAQLNLEFIAWAKIWGPRALYLVLAVVMAYTGSLMWQRRQTTLLDTAFGELEAARLSGSPAALETVARDHAGRGAVVLLATIEAADVYLEQARRGYLPGADTTTGDGVLSQEQIAEALTKADSLYQRAHDSTSITSLPTIHVSSLWGQASIAIQQGEFDDAQRLLGDVIRLAEQALLPALAEVAQERLDTMEEIRTLAPMLSNEQIASITPRTEIDRNTLPSPLLLPLDDDSTGQDPEDQNDPDFVPPKSTIQLNFPSSPKPTPTEPPAQDDSDNDGSDL